jgi:purine-binding chemotaxis protein CheW
MNMAQATAASSRGNTAQGAVSATSVKQMLGSGTTDAERKGKPTGPTKEFLTFRLGAEEYGIDILRVQEIRSYEVPTRIANAPHFLKGVVNLRGVIVPVVDLRVKLGCEKVEYNDFTVVIVLNVKGRVVGAVVDSVSDVLELPEEDLKPSPEMGSTAADNAYVTGIASVGERMLILMDIQALMSSPDMGLMDGAD